MLITRKSFKAGIDLVSSDTQIAEDSYQWLINARQRYGYTKPIKRHVDLTDDIPAGVKQAIIGIGNILMVFVSGKVYYREQGTTAWNTIPNFLMSTTAEEFYVESVPSSTFNFVRLPSANLKAPITVTTDFKVSGTPAGLVVQDGINQPWFIVWDNVNQIFSARVIKNYSQWQNTNVTTVDREYVPIGKQMMYLDGILHVVSSDGQYVMRSITGRPLDFMVNADPSGNKMATETLGGAKTVAYAFDYDPITCIKPSNTAGSFIVGTQKTTRIISTDFNVTIFGEPTFTVSATLNSGIVNQQSFQEILGDYAFIDFDGIKTFNAVYQLKFRGRNSNFSLQVSRLLENVKQQKCASICFDNYALFAVDSKYGSIILVYDTLINKWCGFDITECAQVKQFTVVDDDTKSHLYAITHLNEMFELFADDTDVYAGIMKTPAFVTDQSDIEHKGQYFRPVFNGGSFDGEVTLMEFVDDQESTGVRETKELLVTNGGVNYPVRCPIIPSTQQRVENPSFTTSNGLTGKKLTYILIWTNDSSLVEYTIGTSEMKDQASTKQKQSTYNRTYGINS